MYWNPRNPGILGILGIPGIRRLAHSCVLLRLRARRAHARHRRRAPALLVRLPPQQRGVDLRVGEGGGVEVGRREPAHLDGPARVTLLALELADEQVLEGLDEGGLLDEAVLQVDGVKVLGVEPAKWSAGGGGR